MIWRYRFILFVIIVFFCIIVGRLFYWQVVKAEELSLLGQTQYGIRITQLPTRGEIRTADGFPIAANKLSYVVFANPKEIKSSDRLKISTILSQLLKIDSASVSAALSKDLFWVPIKNNIEADVKDRIEKLKLSGIGFEQNSVRFYPEASMAAHLIGFVGKNEIGGNKGYFGLEGYYDRQLRGKPGGAVQIRDALGKQVVAKINSDAGAVDGRTLILNIDRAIQFMVETKLKDGIERYGAAGGMVGVMDPKTGNIIAMANFPSFDPKNYQDYQDELYKNPFISNMYEPGSTFKALVMAAALDSKVVKPDTKCTICASPVSIGGYEIKTWNGKYYKDTNMIDVIKHSDNTGMVFVAQSLGLSRMLSYLGKFGVGEPTGIDLQGEVIPALKPENKWYSIDLATTGFGQGISVTPIELLDGFSAIANGGIRMEPHVVSKIITADGAQIKIAPRVLDKPIDSKTARVMTEILVNAVNNGEAKWTSIPQYRVAGKTGTAQIPISGHYDPNKTITSFMGFAPADNPKFSILVIIDRPTTSIYGSETAAPIFFDIARGILAYYNIPPKE